MNYHFKPEKLKKGKQWRTSVSGSGGKSGGFGGDTGATEAEDTLRSRSQARFMDVISWGPIGGLANGLKSVYLDGTPVQNADNSYNFTCTIDERTGEAEQDPTRLLDTTDTETSVGQVVAQAIPVTRTLSGDYDAFKVRIRLASLKKQNSSGKIVAHKVTYKIEWSPSGAGTWQHITGSPFTLKGKNNSPYFVDYRFTPPSDPSWDIRVTRISADDSDSSETSLIYFDAVIGVVDQKFSYPYSAYYAWKVNAKQFGTSIPQRKYDVFGRIIRVPTNYDPEARTYTGFWDGTFKLAWSDDPAWCYLDMHNWLYGTDTDDEEINLGWLYTISQYCSEQVPDGKGGTEPRYSLNVAIYNREEALSLLNKMTSVFRGMTFWANGQIHVMQDRPGTVRGVVGPANSQSGLFNYRSTTGNSRANQIIVSYNDGDNDDQEDIEVVEDNANIIATGLRPLEVQAWGCRSQGQAHRLGEWLLYTLSYDTEIVSYVAGMDHAVYLPGDIIALADPLKSSSFMVAGRVVGVSGAGNRTITLDRPISINVPGDDYAALIVDETGVARYYDIVEPPDGATTITLSTDFIGTPSKVKHNMWAVYNKDVGRRLYRIVNIRERGGRREVTALLHNPSKYGYIERDLSLDAPPTNPFVDGQLQAPLFFAATPYSAERAGSINKVDLLCSWTKPPDNRILDFQLQFSEVSDSPDWKDVYTGDETSFTLEDLDLTNTKAVRIRSRGVGKSLSAWQTISNIVVTSRAAAPLAPTGLSVISETSGGALRLSWSFTGGVKPADFLHCEIYRSTTNTIGSATLIGTTTNDRFVDTNLTPGTTYYYWVRIKVLTDNPTYQYSAFAGSATATVLTLPLFSILDNSIIAQMLADDSVDARHMMDNSVLGPAIAASSVTTLKIAAQAIIASHLTLTDLNNSVMNGRFRIADGSASLDGWVVGNVTTAHYDAADVAHSTRMRSGNRLAGHSNYISVRPGEQFYAGASVHNANAQRAYCQVDFYNSEKTYISTVNGTAATYFTDVKNAWTRMYGRFIAPANAAFARVRLLIDKTEGTNPTTYAYFSDVEFRKAANAQLIVDGAIVADHMSANSVDASALSALSITFGDLQPNSVGGGNILANAIGNEHIPVNEIHGDKIVSNTLNANRIVSNTITTVKLEAGNIWLDTIGDLGSVLTRTIGTGQVTVVGSSVRTTDKEITDGTPETSYKSVNSVTVNIAVAGTPVLIHATGVIGTGDTSGSNSDFGNARIRLLVDGSQEQTIDRFYDDGEAFVARPYVLTFRDTPTVGNHDYEVQARFLNSAGGGGAWITVFAGAALLVSNLKR